MALGVPFIRFEYTTEFMEPLIPNVHYISVDRPNDLFDWMKLDRLGEKHHAELIIKRYLEVKDDDEFLNLISKNAKEYYNKYLSPSSSVDFTIKMLGYEI
jgi:aminoglycoside phosphotransferase family enzyme